MKGPLEEICTIWGPSKAAATTRSFGASSVAPAHSASTGLYRL